MKIDCLVSVTATYYTKDQVFHTDELSGDLMTFGEFETEDEDEYIQRLPEFDHPEDDTEEGMLGVIPEKMDAKVLKDFIDFDMTIVGFDDCDHSYCSGIEHSVYDGGWSQEFEPYLDKLTEYADKVRVKCNQKRGMQVLKKNLLIQHLL